MGPMQLNDCVMQAFQTGQQVSRDAVIRAAVEKEKNRKETGDIVATFADLARYSGLQRDLRDQSMSMDRARAALHDDELAATIAGLGKGSTLDGPGAIAMAERTISLAFKNMQKETAIKLLKRLFSPPETADMATMMGHDMFTEERLNFKSDIISLKEVISDRNKKIAAMTHQLELLKLDKTFLQRAQRELQ